MKVKKIKDHLYIIFLNCEKIWEIYEVNNKGQNFPLLILYNVWDDVSFPPPVAGSAG